MSYTPYQSPGMRGQPGGSSYPANNPTAYPQNTGFDPNWPTSRGGLTGNTNGYLPSTTNSLLNATKEAMPKTETSNSTLGSIDIPLNSYKSVPIYVTSTYEFGFRIHIKDRFANNLETRLGIQFYLKNLVNDEDKDRICQIGVLGLGIVQWLAQNDGTMPAQAPSIKVSYKTTIDTSKSYDERLNTTVKSGNNVRLNNFGVKINSVEIDQRYYYTFNRTRMQKIIHVDSWLNDEKYLTSEEQDITVKHGTNGKKKLTIRLDSLTISPYLDGDWNIAERSGSYIEHRGNDYVRIVWSRGELLYKDETVTTAKSVSCILPSFEPHITPSPDPVPQTITWTLKLSDTAAEIAHAYSDATFKNPITKDILDLSGTHSLGYGVLVLPILVCGSNRYNVRIVTNNNEYQDIIEYPSGTVTKYNLRPGMELLKEFANIKTKKVTLELYHYNKNQITSDVIFKYKDDASLRKLNGFIGTDSDTFNLTIPYDDKPEISNSTAMISKNVPGTKVLNNNIIRNPNRHIYSVTDYITDWNFPGYEITSVEAIKYTKISSSIVNSKTLPLTDFRKYALIVGKSHIGAEATFLAVAPKYEALDMTKITKIELSANDSVFKLAELPNDMNGTDFCNEEIPFTKCAPIALSVYNGRNDSVTEKIGDGTSSNAFTTGSGNVPMNHIISMFDYSIPSITWDINLVETTVTVSGISKDSLKPLATVTITHKAICDPARDPSSLVYESTSDEYAISQSDFGEVTYSLYYRLQYSDGSSSPYYLTNINGISSATKKMSDNTSYNREYTDNVVVETEVLKQSGESNTDSIILYETVEGGVTRKPVQIDFILIWHDYFTSGTSNYSYPIYINTSASQAAQLTTVDPVEVFVDADIQHMGLGVGADYDSGAAGNILNHVTNELDDSAKKIDLYPATTFKNVIVNWDSVFMRNTYFKYAAFFYDGIRANISRSSQNANNTALMYNTDNGRFEYNASSRRYKEDIDYNIDNEEYHKQFEKIKVVKYNYKPTKDSENDEESVNEITDHTPHNLGFIAEDLDEINKDLVVYNKEEVPENYKDRDMLALLYIEVKRQNEKIKELEAEIAELKAK